MKSIGKYQVVEDIGASSTGQTYRARDTFRNSDFAIKLLKTVPGMSADARQQFGAYLTSCADLTHRHIAKIQDLGEVEEGIFIATEWHSGMDLWRYLGTRQEVLLDQKLVLIAQVAEGLAFAHSRNIAHGDLKPSNIFVDESRDVTILDFGIARWLQALLEAGSRPEALVAKYLAPEQILNRPFDGRSDIFALGVMLYELVAGRYPFSEDAGLLPREIVHTDPAPLQGSGQQIPPELEQLAFRALQKDPERRLQTAEEFASGLYLAAQQVRRLASGALSRGAPAPPVSAASPATDPNLSSTRSGVARPLMQEPQAQEAVTALPSAFAMPSDPPAAPSAPTEQPAPRKRPQDSESEPRPWTARSYAYRNSTKPPSEPRSTPPSGIIEPGRAASTLSAPSRPALPPPINPGYEPPQSFITPDALLAPLPEKRRQTANGAMTKGVIAAGVGLILAAILVSSFISRQHLRAAEKKNSPPAVTEPLLPAPENKLVSPPPASEMLTRKTAEPVAAAQSPAIARVSAKETLNGPVRVLWESGKYAQALALVDEVLVTEPDNNEGRAWKKKIRAAQAAEAALK